jgi:hypothetical protein
VSDSKQVSSNEISASDSIATAVGSHYHPLVSKKEKFIFVILGSLLLLILIAWSPWSALLYHGDGKFSDELFFYPRYWVRFAEIPLNERSEHHFRFRGMPNEEMGLILYVRGEHAKEENRDSLAHLPVTIEAKLSDGKGNVVCFASGRPDDGNRDGIWVLMSGHDEAGYWHYQCNGVRMSTFKTYDLMIRVADVGANADKVLVIPTLNGGGTELP